MEFLADMSFNCTILELKGKADGSKMSLSDSFIVPYWN